MIRCKHTIKYGKVLTTRLDEKGGKEAGKLYEQVKAFREIMDRVSSMNSADSIGTLSKDTAVDGLFYILKNLKIIEENKTESNLVTSELTKYVDEVRVAITELTSLYKDYIYIKVILRMQKNILHI